MDSDRLSALSPIPLENIYHVGLVVDDLDKAMVRLGEELGLDWAAPRRGISTDLMIPSVGASYRPRLSLTYSTNGPPYLELIEGTRGPGIWSIEGGPRLHHLGAYVEDLPSEASKLVSRGLTMECFSSGVTAERASGPEALGLAYFRSDIGLRIELVDVARRVALERWIHG